MSTIQDDVYVHKSTIPNAGKGLFAHRTFTKGEVVGEYTGHWTWTNDDVFDIDTINNTGYILQYSKGVYIDGDPSKYPDKTSLVSYINTLKKQTSDKKYNTRICIDRIRKRVLIRATRTVCKGEEFFLNYPLKNEFK